MGRCMVYGNIYSSEGRQYFRLSPLDCPTAKTGGVVNGGQSPFILSLTGSPGFAIAATFLQDSGRKD